MANRNEKVLSRFMAEAFSGPLVDNALRGYFAEALVAEALGSEWRLVSKGWHPWDIQFGADDDEFPKRIRIQVKNSAALQVWHGPDDAPSDCSFNLTWRKMPNFVSVENTKIGTCEEGFLCDLYVLCHHPIIDHNVANQLNSSQWDFYLLPVVGPNSGVTSAELNWLSTGLAKTGKSSSTIRKPKTMAKGIRGRLPIQSRKFEEVNTKAVFQALGIPYQK